jgi:O-acetyl-ADP-ribose deacetylase
MEEQHFSYHYANNKELIVSIKDLLAAPVDAIVNPANSGLSHGGGLAAQIASEAGKELEDACDNIIEQKGMVPVTKAVITNAGRLPYKGVIHAVGPKMGSGDEMKNIARTIVYSLKLADRKGWQSLAFPAISTGIFGIPVATCAQAFKKAIPYFWEKHTETTINAVWVCLLVEDFKEFKKFFE